MKRKFLFVLLAVLICMAVFTAAVFATEESTTTVVSSGEQANTAGTGAEYSWDLTSDGTLTFYPGTSKYIHSTPDLTTYTTWRTETTDGVENQDRVKKMVFSDGIYQIVSRNAAQILSGYENLVTIEFGVDVYVITNGWTGGNLFDDNPSLTTIKSNAYPEYNAEGTVNLLAITTLKDSNDQAYMFSGCKNIKKVIFADTNDAVAETGSYLSYFGANMFSGCTSLESVNIPAWVTSIEANALNGCTALKTIDIPASVTNIGANAFANCTALETVTFAQVDATAITIDSTAFTGCTAKFNVIGNEMKELLVSLGVAEENITAVTIISTGSQLNPKDATATYFSWELDYKGVLTFKTGTSTTVDTGNDESGLTAFNTWRTETTAGQSVPNEDLVKHIIVEDDFKYAWFSHAKPAFCGYDNLVSINMGQIYRLGNSWTGYGIFQDNPKLVKVTNSNTSENNADGVMNLELIVRYEDSRCKEALLKNTPLITKIVFCDTTTRDETDTNTRKFGDNAFSGVSTLTSVNIPSFTTYIGSKAFYGTGITEITIPASVTTIGASAFATSALQSITFEGTDPTAITIDSTAFDNAAALKATVYSEEMKALLVDTYGFTADNVSVNVGGSFGDFTWEIEGGVLTISGTGTALAFESEITADTLSNIPWAAYSAQITSVVLDAEVTSLCDYAFAGLANCTAITIPASLTDLSASYVFSGNSALNNVTVSGKDAVSGVIDLFNATAVSADLFDGAAISASVYLPKLSDTSFITSWAEDMTALTIVTYPTCDLATAVRANEDIELGYLPESYDPLLRRVSVAVDTASGNEIFKYSFDEATGTLTFSKPDSAADGTRTTLYLGDAGEQTVEKITNEDGSTKTVRTPLADGFAAWKTVWCDAIFHAYVGDFSANQVGMQNNDSPFSNLTKLVNVHFSFDTVRFTSAWPRTGMFENCKSLTTISYGDDDTIDGEIDLSFWALQDRTITKMFKNCTSITKIIFPIDISAEKTDSAYAIGFGAEMFFGCTSLTEMSIPDTFTIIGKDAFRNCTNLTKVVIENANCDVSALTSNSFPKTTVIDTFSTDIATTLSGLGFTVRDLDGVLSAEGFQIRLEDYNGLRGLFSFDVKKNETVESYGYILQEYGILMTPASEYDYWGGIDFMPIEGEFVPETSVVKRMAVYKNGDFVGKVLPSTIVGSKIDFAGSVIRYSSNFKTDVYIGAYAIYRDNAGNYYLVNEVYEDSEGNNAFNLYDIALDIFVNHTENGILDENIDEVAVWNTILQGADTDIYETAVGSYDGITLTLAKEASDGTAYIPFIRSENGIAITEEMITAAEAMLADSTYTLGETICVTIANANTTPSVDAGAKVLNSTVTTPNRYNREDDKAQHHQGMGSDGTYIYYSFTGKIVKVRMSDGVEVGTLTVTDEIDAYSAHMGNVICHQGKLYGSLSFWGSDKNYIAIVDTDKIVGDVTWDIMDAVYYKDDDDITLYAGTENETADKIHGGTGVDSITVGKVPGGGFVLPDGSKITDTEDYLVFGAGSAYQHPTKRHDDDYLRLRFVDFDDVAANASPLTAERIASEETPINSKYTAYAYAGATCVQCIAYDKDTGDYHFATYGRDVGLDDTYPAYEYFVIDGSKKLYLTELELGQHTPEDSEVYDISIERAAQYKDKADLDGDGDTEEQMLGWTAELICICRDHDLEAHEAIDYDNSGYASRICGTNNPAMAQQGIISMGNDYFYFAYYNNDSIDGVTYFGEDARLYRLHRYNGAWTFVRIE